MNHSWAPVKLNVNGRVCQGWHCSNCQYVVFTYADPSLKGGSVHLAEHKAIISALSVTAADAEKLTVQYGVSCR